MTFGHALEVLEKGEKMERSGWNGKGMWIAMQKPDANSKMGRPYLYIKSVDGYFVPWAPSQTDLLADDWQKV